MSVRKVDKNNDFTFGNSLRDYAREGEEVHQNVTTRLKSWYNDWFLGVDEYIDWEFLLSNLNTSEEIQKQVRAIILNTVGVARIISLNIEVNKTQRNATVECEYDTLFDTGYQLEFNVL